MVAFPCHPCAPASLPSPAVNVPPAGRPRQAARPGLAKPRVRRNPVLGTRPSPPSSTAGPHRTTMHATTEPALQGSELKMLLSALIALKKGETGVRLPV